MGWWEGTALSGLRSKSEARKQRRREEVAVREVDLDDETEDGVR